MKLTNRTMQKWSCLPASYLDQGVDLAHVKLNGTHVTVEDEAANEVNVVVPNI